MRRFINRWVIIVNFLCQEIEVQMAIKPNEIARHESIPQNEILRGRKIEQRETQSNSAAL